MTGVDLIVLAVLAGVFVAFVWLLGADGRAIVSSHAFLAAAGLMAVATAAFIGSAALRCWDEWGCEPDGVTGPFAAIVLLLPTPYIVAGLLGPPRPWIAGLLLSVLHLGCGVLAASLALITGPESDSSDGFVQMGAQIFLVMAMGFGILVIASGSVVTAVVAWMAHPAYDDTPAGGIADTPPRGRRRRVRHLVDRG